MGGGECPRCGDRLEFTAGRCARSSSPNHNPNHNHNHNHSSEPTSLQDLEIKLLEWITKYKEEIKIVLAQQHAVGYKIIEFINGLGRLIPVLGLIHNQDDTNNSNNHLIHILEQLCNS